MSPALAGRFLTTGPPGKSDSYPFYEAGKEENELGTEMHTDSLFKVFLQI